MGDKQLYINTFKQKYGIIISKFWIGNKPGRPTVNPASDYMRCGCDVSLFDTPACQRMCSQMEGKAGSIVSYRIGAGFLDENHRFASEFNENKLSNLLCLSRNKIHPNNSLHEQI